MSEARPPLDPNAGNRTGQPIDAPPGTLVWTLVQGRGVLLLTVLVGFSLVYGVESWLSLARQSSEQDVRSRLQHTAQRLVPLLSSRQAFRLVMAPLLHEVLVRFPGGSSVAIRQKWLDRQLREILTGLSVPGLPLPFHLSRFDPAGRLLDQCGRPHDPADLEDLWRGIQDRQEDHIHGTRLADPEIQRQADRVCRRLYGPGWTTNLFSSLGFLEWPIPGEDGRIIQVGVLMNWAGADPRSREGFLVEFPRDGLNWDRVFHNGLSLGLHDQKTIAAAVCTGRQVLAGNIDPGLLEAIPSRDNDLVSKGPWFLLRYPLSEPAGHFLLLGHPLPPVLVAAPVIRSGTALLAVGCFVLGLWGSRQWRHLIPQTLRGQILGSIVIGAVLPLAFFLEISAERFLTLPATDHLEWETRLNRRLLRIEQELQHYFARLQGQFRGLAEGIGRAGGSTSDVGRLFRSQRISGDVIWLDATTRKTLVCSDESQQVSQMLGSKLVGQILDDALDQLLDRSGLPTGGREKKRRLLSFQDIAGEGIPLGEVFRHLGKVVRLQLEDSDAYCICDQVRDSRGGVLGLLLLSNASNRPITRNNLRHKLFQTIWDIPPIRIFRISSGGIIPDFLGDRTRLLAMAPEEGQGRAGGSTHLQIDGQERLAVVQAKPSVRRETLAATVPLAVIQTNTRTLQGLTGAVLFAFVGTLLGAGFLLVRRITRPIKELHDGAERVTAGRIETTVPVQGRDELGQLAHAFNQMTEGMRQRERMRRFLSPEVWRNTEDGESGPVARRCRVCALFSDLRGFTTLSERHSPQDTVAMLNDYFTTMDGILRRHGGYIDKLIGDAILAVFLPGLERPDPALRAIHAGLDMRQALVVFNRKREDRGAFPIENGVGIHVDEAILGRIGHREGRQDLTVIGPLTSVAARLESLSKHGRDTRILISAAVRDFLIAQPQTAAGLSWQTLTVDGETGFEIASPANGHPLP